MPGRTMTGTFRTTPINSVRAVYPNPPGLLSISALRHRDNLSRPFCIPDCQRLAEYLLNRRKDRVYSTHDLLESPP